MSEPPPLHNFPMFASVDEATLLRLASEAKFETYRDGETLFRQGEPMNAFVLVVKGFVKLLRMAPTGDETVVGLRADGETVMDAPTDAAEISLVSAEAVGAVTVLKIPAARFVRALAESPALTVAALGEAKCRNAELIGEIESLKALGADQRLARFLLALAPQGSEDCRFRLPYDKRLLAARLGVTQETLSRSFAKLRDYGVRTETREVFLESVSRLRAQFGEPWRTIPPR